MAIKNTNNIIAVYITILYKLLTSLQRVLLSRQNKLVYKFVSFKKNKTVSMSP